MLIAVASDGTGGGWWRPVDLTGTHVAPATRVEDLAAAVAERETALDRVVPGAPGLRWVWTSTSSAYPPLLHAGVRVTRCHDLELTEALLLGHAGRFGEPRSVAAVLARRSGAPVPADPPPRPREQQEGLFGVEPAVSADPTADLVTACRDQQDRIAAIGGRFPLLVAAESAGALAAAEMSDTGLPWRADIHDQMLTELLGPRSPVGGLPRELAALSAAIATALNAPGLHPDSPAELRRAFARVGIMVPDTRAWSLREVDHPAVPLVLRFKELYRIFTAHGWSWCETWVSGGRFRPEYVPGGVVSGRWATRGGGALQIPKVVRRAVVADAGWRFVVADAGQLEPRVLAAVSGDPGLSAAAGSGDLYAALAEESFGGDRSRAKLALLGAMYGQTGGSALPALAVLRQRYPVAWRYVEEAARVGAAGGLVRSWLGRTCPPADAPQPGVGVEPGPAVIPPSGSDSMSRSARGRFTRNFVIQATAAEWALTLLALLRTDCPGELVFFQHDEVLVHCPAAEAPAVTEAIHSAAGRASRLLFGDSPVRFPLDLATVRCYADAAGTR